MCFYLLYYLNRLYYRCLLLLLLNYYIINHHQLVTLFKILFRILFIFVINNDNNVWYNYRNFIYILLKIMFIEEYKKYLLTNKNINSQYG